MTEPNPTCNAAVTLRLPAAMLAQIKHFAQRDRRSVGAWIRRSLEGSIQYAIYEDPAARKLAGPVHRRQPATTLGTFNSAVVYKSLTTPREQLLS